MNRTGCSCINSMAAIGLGCISKSVCSNLGPAIACDLGIWLFAHVTALFGACSFCNCACSGLVAATSGEVALTGNPGVVGTELAAVELDRRNSEDVIDDVERKARGIDDSRIILLGSPNVF